MYVVMVIAAGPILCAVLLFGAGWLERGLDDNGAQLRHRARLAALRPKGRDVRSRQESGRS